MMEIKKESPTKNNAESELTHSMAHYLLTIHKLKENKGYARVTDIAKDLGLTKGSVSIALTSLKKKNLVVEDESKFLSLSDLGHEEVHHILASRTLIYYFLKDILTVNDKTAHADSCLIEHLISAETRDKLFAFLKTISDEKLHLTKFSTGLDLKKFKSSHDFFHAQKGDIYLAHDDEF